jgi:1-acyl-sn-glycerol-3-phosphate acyltransferase
MVSSPISGHDRRQRTERRGGTPGTHEIREARMIPPLLRAAKTALDWAATGPFLLAFGLLLVVFDPLQRVAFRISRRAQEITVGWLQVGISYALRLAGTRYRIRRSPSVRPRTPYLIVANHQSMFDIPILSWLLFTNFPKFVSKRELGRGIPSISYNLQVGGNVLIDRKDRDGALAAIRSLAATVRERGVSAVIYPEGTRAKTGELGPFRPAGALELMKGAPDAAILPVAMDGLWKVVRRGLRPVPFGTIVNVHIGDPIPRTAGDDPRELLARAEREIRATVAAWRGETVREVDPSAPPQAVAASSDE